MKTALIASACLWIIIIMVVLSIMGHNGKTECLKANHSMDICELYIR